MIPNTFIDKTFSQFQIAAMIKSKTCLNLWGLILSGLCFLHCLMLPIVLSSLPLFFNLIIPSTWLNLILLIMIWPIAVISIKKGYQLHGNKLIVFMGLAGLGLMSADPLLHFLSPDPPNSTQLLTHNPTVLTPFWTWLNPLGSLILMTTHLYHYLLLQRTTCSVHADSNSQCNMCQSSVSNSASLTQD
ncbi:MAG: MerC domain-containing protein [Bdellovibrionaceae bacterium]|nr:MerC domain-containing protein [Pseudobdellovibrionaceae bacterium]MDW8189794.1 MerC domain-containing protein [Pseudobdellovibrionaceae bacterium]